MIKRKGTNHKNNKNENQYACVNIIHLANFSSLSQPNTYRSVLPGPNKLFLLPKFKAQLSLLKTLLMYKFFLFLSFYQNNYFNQKLLYLLEKQDESQISLTG